MIKHAMLLGSLTFVSALVAAPALGAAVAPAPAPAIVGKWQTALDANGTASIIVFGPGGRATVSWRRGNDIERYKYFNGKPLTLQYAVSGDKLTITYPNHKVNEYEFTVTAETLTYTKVLIFQSQPNTAGKLQGATMTRFHG